VLPQEETDGLHPPMVFTKPRIDIILMDTFMDVVKISVL